MFNAIKTSRLILRTLQDKDFADLFAYRNDKQVAKYQAWTETSEQAIKQLITEQKLIQPGIKLGEWFMFAITLEATGTLIGDCTFCINKENSCQAELGITLAGYAQGKGYAHEAIQTVLNYLFTKYDKLQRVIMISYKKNISCIKLLEKLTLNMVNSDVGFKQIQADKILYKLKKNEIIYPISREAWHKLTLTKM